MKAGDSIVITTELYENRTNHDGIYPIDPSWTNPFQWIPYLEVRVPTGHPSEAWAFLALLNFASRSARGQLLLEAAIGRRGDRHMCSSLLAIQVGMIGEMIQSSGVEIEG